jgi:hypothetical protein
LGALGGLGGSSGLGELGGMIGLGELGGLVALRVLRIVPGGGLERRRGV